MSGRLEVLRLLADGEEHSGEALAASLAVSRAAVWKRVQQLEQWGLEVQAVAGHGYRLSRPLDLLDAAAVRQALPGMVLERLRRLTLVEEIDSTNAALLAVDDLPNGKLDACIAEFQHQGRGRRGRSWLAPFGSGVCLSVSWCFDETPPQLPALSLAVGVAVRRALAMLGIDGIGLKWPNDVIHGDAKLGGILCELRAEAAGPAYVVTGIGLNVDLPPAVGATLAAQGLPPVSLAELATGRLPSRSLLCSTLLGQLALTMMEFEQSGFATFREEWQASDALRARRVRLQVGERAVEGIARGIDSDGALLFDGGRGIERVLSGEVSVRPAA